MALENGEVLQNLTNQLQEVTQQLNTLGAVSYTHLTLPTKRIV